MTMILTKEIPCPVCGSYFTANLYATINVSLDPLLKVEFLNGQINRVTCPNCKEEGLVPIPLLYHDMDNHIMVFVTWNNELNWGQQEVLYKESVLAPMPFSMMEIYRNRVVFGYSQLAEKIRIFDSGLDDKIIECLKFLHTISDQKQAGRILKILFSEVKGDDIVFADLDSDNAFSFPRKTYDDILNNQGAMDSLLASFKDAYYINVNRLL